MNNHITKDLQIFEYKPVVMLWKNNIPNAKVAIYQESPNYQTLDDTVYWNSCFPAAYLWADGKESAIFFNMQPMDWFSFHNGIKRFKSIQICTREINNKIGIGMDMRKYQGEGTKIPSGDMIIDFYLYGNSNFNKPTKMDALNITINAFEECFSSQINWPRNYVDPDNLSYDFISSKVAQQLMLYDVTYKITPFNRLRNNVVDSINGIWTDIPAFPENFITDVIRRPDYAVGNKNGHNLRTVNDIYGDWNCANNALIPWIAYERLSAEPLQHEFINKAIENLKVYYDPDAKLIRSFECSDDYKNTSVEFSFQNFFFSIGTLKAS